jgi:hypothetical protein
MNTSLLTEVLKDVFVVTPGLLKSIREDREPPGVQRAFGQVSLVVGGLGETDHGGVVPGQDGGGEGDGAERKWAEDATEEVRLDSFLGCTASIEPDVGTPSNGVCNASESQMGI